MALPPSSTTPGYVVVKEYTRARPGEGQGRRKKRQKRRKRRRGLRYSSTVL